MSSGSSSPRSITSFAPIRHVVAAVDFSDHSLTAAHAARAIAAAGQADLTLVHAIEPLDIKHPAAAMLPLMVLDQAEQAARERSTTDLEALAETLRQAGGVSRVWVEIGEGRAAMVIARSAIGAAADLIVMGTRGKSQVASWLLGSATAEVAASAPCPVLVTRGESAIGWTGRFDRALVGIDFSELSGPLARACNALVSEGGVLDLVNTWPLPPFIASKGEGAGPESETTLKSDAIEWARGRLEEFRAECGLSEARASVHVEVASASAGLLARAEGSDADLIAVGSHGRERLGERLLGTTAERILRHSRSPVLMFPATALVAARTRPCGKMARFDQLNPDGPCKTYLVASTTGEAMIVDPRADRVEAYLEMAAAAKLELRYVVDTHVHDDHDSGAAELASRSGATHVVHHDFSGPCDGTRVGEGDSLILGDLAAQILDTPGHAAGSLSLLFPDRLLCGDFLHIGSAGAGAIVDRSAHWHALQKLSGYPGELLVFPGHDRSERGFSTLAAERVDNPCLQARSEDEYVGSR